MLIDAHVQNFKEAMVSEADDLLSVVGQDNAIDQVILFLKMKFDLHGGHD